MFKKLTSMITATIMLATGLNVLGAVSANAANEMTLTSASKVKGVTVTLATPDAYGSNQGSVNLTSAQAADTSNSGSFVTDFVKTDPSATTVVALYPDATMGMGNPSSFPGSYTYDGTAALSNNKLFVIKVTKADNSSYTFYLAKVVIVSTDATLSFANSKLKSVTLGSATAYDDIAQLGSSSNRTSVTLSSTQASSTFGDQLTFFSGAGNFATAVAKKFASSVSSLNSSAFSSATTVTSSTALTDGDYIVIRVIAQDATTTKYYGYSVTVSSSGGGGGSSNDPTLNIGTVRIKGVTPASASAKNTIGLLSAGSDRTNVTLTTAQASSTSGLATLFEGTNPAAQVTVKKFGRAPSLSNEIFQAATAFTSQTVLVDRDTIIVRVVSTDTTTTRWYGYTILVSGGSSSSQQSAEQVAAAAAETAALLAAAIAKAKVVLATQFSGNKPATLEQFLDANYGVRNSNVAEKVSAAILKLPVADREKTEKINQIINLENFIDRVAVSGTRSSVNTGELVSRGLLPADSVYKYSVVQGLASYPDGSLNSLEKIETAIKEQIIKAGARKAKTAEIKAKIAARNK